MIMVTLVCGKFPWRKASLDEYYYRLYVSTDEDVLYSMFDISPEFNTLLKSVFTVNPRKRISLRTLRDQILHMRSFGSGKERTKKLVPDIRVPVFIDLDSVILNDEKERPLEKPLKSIALDDAETAVDLGLLRISSGIVDVSPFPHEFAFPPEPAYPEDVHIEPETDADAERARRRSIQTIIELLETTLPSVPKTKCNVRRPPLVPHHTQETGDVWSSKGQSDEEPVTPETYAADAARPVAVMDAADGSPSGESSGRWLAPSGLALNPTHPPQPVAKHRNKSEILSSVLNAKNRFKDMMHAVRTHPA